MSLRSFPSTSAGPSSALIGDSIQFSVIVPTLNEADNVDPLLTRLSALDLPEGMPAVEWYKPTGRGLEERIKQKIEELKNRK